MRLECNVLETYNLSTYIQEDRILPFSPEAYKVEYPKRIIVD